jgi:hypothetical protein
MRLFCPCGEQHTRADFHVQSAGREVLCPPDVPGQWSHWLCCRRCRSVYVLTVAEFDALPMWVIACGHPVRYLDRRGTGFGPLADALHFKLFSAAASYIEAREWCKEQRAFVTLEPSGGVLPARASASNSPTPQAGAVCSHEWKTQASGLDYCGKCGTWRGVTGQ